MIQARTKAPAVAMDAVEFQRLKTSIHEEIVESLDLSMAGLIAQDVLEAEVNDLAREIIARRQIALSEEQRAQLFEELHHEVFGLGPIEPLMHDPTVSDILVNGAHEVYVERHGVLERTPIVFADDQHVMRIVQRIVARIGRRIDEVSPMVDARLPDGSRVNAVAPPLALDGPKLSIRRFGAERLTLEQLLKFGSISEDMARFLEAAVAARVSFLISGGTGAGKTTLLNALSLAIPREERIVTIEDSAELLLQHPHVARLETRQANTEGSGEVPARDLVRNSLRMRPDRIIVGEVRGAEALDMLQAMNTGHEGSLTTIHANDTRDALSRLEMMVAMSGFELPVPVVRQYIAAGIKLVVHVARLKGGVRRVTRISEIVEVRDGQYHLEDVFGFKPAGLDADGKIQGDFYRTGYAPRCLERMAECGVELSREMFAV